MKKIIGYSIFLIINYLLLSLIVFIFSLVSLNNGKVYDLLWIKYVQTNLYFKTGFRNIFQHSTNDCVEYDEDLIYVPKKGKCKFSNAEFDTVLSFDEFRRLNLIDDEVSENDKIVAVLGDSIAMGWGVEDDETFSYDLQKNLNKKVINLGVSSYGTLREIKRLKKNKYYNQVDTIIIQYHVNDYGENIYMDPEKKYNQEDFDKYFNEYQKSSEPFRLMLRLYKKTLRLLFSHINDIIFPSLNIKEWEIDKELNQLQKIISTNFSNEEKKILVFITVEPWERMIYDKSKNYSFDFMEIKFKPEHKFIVDDHPNTKGHKFISQKLKRRLFK